MRISDWSSDVCSSDLNPLALGLIAAGGIWLLSDSDAKLSTLKPHRRSSSGNEDWDQHDGFHRSYLDHMSKVQRIPDEDDLTFQRRRNYARADYLMIERNHDEDEKIGRASCRERVCQYV